MQFKMFYYIDGLRYAMRDGRVYVQNPRYDVADCSQDWTISCCTQKDIYSMVDNGIAQVRNF